MRRRALATLNIALAVITGLVIASLIPNLVIAYAVGAVVGTVMGCLWVKIEAMLYEE